MSLGPDVKDVVRRHLDSLTVEDPEPPFFVDYYVSKLWGRTVVDALGALASIGSRPQSRVPKGGRRLLSLYGTAAVPDAGRIGALPDQVQNVVFVDDETGRAGVPNHSAQDRLVRPAGNGQGRMEIAGELRRSVTGGGQ